jgi:LSD1 subclass zinc finger protein
MSIPFKCSSCGGPLQYDGGEITVRCEFCSNLIIVPEELRESFQPKRAAIPFLDQMTNLKEIGRLIRGGNIIEAIKLYRETFGVGLKEAKDSVENLSSGIPVEVTSTFGTSGQQPVTPGRSFVKMPQSPQMTVAKGCSPFVLALVIFVPILLGGIGIALLAFSGFREYVTKTVTGDNKTSPSGDKTTSGFAREVMKFGTDGIGAGQFKDARTVAIDGAGHIFAADYTGGRVQVFDSNGKFLSQWMVDPKMPLLKIAADRKGVVYVVQKGDITRYEGMTGQSLGKVQSSGRSYSDCIITLDGGLVAVQDSEDLVRFDASGQVVITIKKSVSSQSGDSELDAKVAIDGQGNLYAMGRFNDAVFKFSPEGRFITRIGGKGDEPGLFRALLGIAVDGQGRIFVSDIKGIQIFDTNGRYLDVIKIEREVPFGMVFNDKNELFVAARTKIVKYTLNK